MQDSIYLRINRTKAASVDLVDYEGGKMITRIFVPIGFQGQGWGTKLMRELTAEADDEQVVLWIGVNAYGELNLYQLTAWYESYEFKHVDGIYRRDPQ